MENIKNLLNQYGLAYDYAYVGTITIGCNDKDSGRQDKTIEEVMALINEALSEKGILGSTINKDNIGLWEGQEERSVRVEVRGTLEDMEKVIQFSLLIRDLMNQCCVLTDFDKKLQSFI